MTATPNPQNATDEYLLLIRGTHWSHGLSPAELQRVMTDFYSWVDGLVKRGVHRGAQPLVEEGRIVSGTKGVSVTDGVFAESKEAIAGYFLLAVGSIDEAVASVSDLGGRVVMDKATVPGTGSFCVLADPTGGIFGILDSETMEE